MSEVVTTTQLQLRLKDLPAKRHLIALAGAPASGKSTLAETLVNGLNSDRPGRATILPMDGFHFDDHVLVARGHRPRKGAPFTFDVGGLRHLLLRLIARDEEEVAIPVFDRNIEIARAGAALVPQSVEIVVVEGNYLLLDQSPWQDLHNLFDLTVAIEVPEDVLHQRLTARWKGFQLSPDEINNKLNENDLPNGRLVRSESIGADLVLQ